MRVFTVAARASSRAGGKAAGLRWLVRHGYPVPPAWVVVPGPDGASHEAVATALAGVVRDGQRYAVRSSAAVEDGSEHSFAGQFDSVLDVRGVDAVARAVATVVDSASTDSVETYAHERTGSTGPVAMSVVVQEMVPAAVAGVAFSVNPVTGLSEVMIESVRGGGEALVQRGETPQRWVRKYGAWRERPEDPSLPAEPAERIADDVTAMARAYGRPVDVEWAVDEGGALHYLQLRPITGVGRVSYYSNRFSREVLPGIIVPLVWSVNIPIVNGAWIALLERLVGDTGLEPGHLAERIYGRAYFNMGALGTVFDMLGLPREFLEQLSGTERPEGGLTRPRMSPKALAKLPRVLWFAAGLLGYARRTETTLGELGARLDRVRSTPPESMADASAVIAALDELRPIVERVAGLNVLTPLLSEFHNHRLASRLSARGLDYGDVDFANRDDGSEGRDPAVAIARLAELAGTLGPEACAALDAGDTAALRRDPGAAAFLERLDGVLAAYGHFSDSGNDFSHVPWREDPGTVLRLVRSQAGQRAARHRTTRTDVRARAGRGALAAFDRAARYQVLREQVSSFYTLAYGYHRPLYLRLARLLGIDGWEPAGRAVFHLTDAEVRSLASGALTAERARALVAERLAEEELVRDVIVPDVVVGQAPAPVVARPGGVLHGAATSSGIHEGRAVLVESPSRAPELAHGDVLVVPYSDVAWTPLFSRAGAIVAESGGFLSHASIVAREYGIPAVVSVPGALHRIPHGSHVVVDGLTGTVTVVDEDAADGAEGRAPAADDAEGRAPATAGPPEGERHD